MMLAATKRILLPIFFILISQESFCSAYTISFYVSSHAFGDSVENVESVGLGTGIRTVTCPSETGFYSGGDLFFGLPMLVGDPSDDEFGDLFLSFKVPFGYRWPGQNRSMGFYLAAGPDLQLLTEFNEYTYFYFSLFLELGWQTNKTRGVGFHIGLQFSICPYKWSESYYFFPPFPTFGQFLQIGISWRRIPRR